MTAVVSWAGGSGYRGKGNLRYEVLGDFGNFCRIGTPLFLIHQSYLQVY